MRLKALLLTMLFCASMLSGCFGSGDDVPPSADDLDIGVMTLTGGVFQNVKLTADSSMAVYIPYLLMNPYDGFVQNSTVIDLSSGESVQISILAPPRISEAFLLIGENGRQNWPTRDSTESWRSWAQRGGPNSPDGGAIERVPVENSTLDRVNHSVDDGGKVAYLTIPIMRPAAPGFGPDGGGDYSTGIINGSAVYDRLH